MEIATQLTNLVTPDGQHVQEVMRAAENKLHQLVEPRSEIMKRIGTVKRTLAGLASVFDDSVLNPELSWRLGHAGTRKHSGFTPACRSVLMESAGRSKARQAWRELQRKFPSCSNDTSITTVCSRLVGYGEACSSIGG